jgi:acylphosphatase
MSDIVRRVIIRGLVQGVGFRAFVEYTAHDLGLKGWVRNCRDGAVEAVFVGPAEMVAAMIEACRRGPQSARVDAVEEADASAAELGRRYPGEAFSMLPTE